jgi:hypothetical protein
VFWGEEARTDANLARAELYGDLSGFVKSILRYVMIESGGWMSRLVRSKAWQNIEGTSDGAPARSPVISRLFVGSMNVRLAT